MEEEKKQEAAPAGGSDGAELADELKRIRGRHKALKIVTFLLSGLFIVIILAVAYMYKRMSGLTEMFSGAQQSFSAGKDPSVPNSPLAVFNGMPAAGQSGNSSLGMITGMGSLPDEPSGAGPGGDISGITAADREELLRVFEKYSDRPIVKDFVADLKRDPDYKKALAAGTGNNPAAMMDAFKNTKNIQKLAMKYAVRPDFMPLLTELMNDPQVRPLLAKLPHGGMGPAASMFTPKSGQQSAAMPQAAPSYPAPDQGSGEIDESMRVDPSAMGGTSQSGEAPIKKKAPPPMAE